MAKPFQKGSSSIAMCIISWIYLDIYLTETTNKQRARAVAAAPMTTLHAPGEFSFHAGSISWCKNHRGLGQIWWKSQGWCTNCSQPVGEAKNGQIFLYLISLVNWSMVNVWVFASLSFWPIVYHCIPFCASWFPGLVSCNWHWWWNPHLTMKFQNFWYSLWTHLLDCMLPSSVEAMSKLRCVVYIYYIYIHARYIDCTYVCIYSIYVCM